MKKITAKDIAKAAGVSPATVSRVVNCDNKVSAQIRSRVLHAARELNYDLTARNGSYCIGVVTEPHPMAVNGYFAELFEAVSRNILQRNCRLELIYADMLEHLDERVIRGAIDLTTHPNFVARWEENTTLPLVRINANSHRINNIGSVIYDGAEASRLAVQKLQSLGHREIYYFSSESMEEEKNKVTRRWFGFLDAMRSQGVRNPEKYGILCSQTDPLEILTSALEKALKKGCTALICPNEILALRVDPCLRKLGLRIPQDISLISWEYNGVSEYLDPPRTTIVIDYEKLAQAALDMLQTMLDKRLTPPDVHTAPHMIERASIAPISAQVSAQEEHWNLTLTQRRILDVLQSKILSAEDLAIRLDLQPDNGNFRHALRELCHKGRIKLFYPETPRHPRQKYMVEALNTSETIRRNAENPAE